MKKKTPKGSIKRLIGSLMIILMFAVGSLIALYPFYINALNDFLDEKRLEQVHKDLAQRQDELEKRRQENEALSQGGFAPGNDPFAEKISDKKDEAYYRKHLIGKIAIPKIEVDIPLFDTTNHFLLNRGASVLQGTSFPTGGKNTHTVISAHSGLPDRVLFTDLEKVEKGDQFVLTVYGKKMAYEVNQIEVVLPNETSALKIEAGKDLATLITCTPYMINSHRLLVTGHRVPYTEKLAKAVASGNKAREQKNILIITGTVLLILVLLYLLYRAIKAFILKRRRFDLTFVRQNQAGTALNEVEYILFDKKGKAPVIRQGDTLKAQSTADGTVTFKDLPGAMYTLKEVGDNPHASLSVGVKGWRQKAMQFYPKKSQKDWVITGSQPIIRK